MHQVHPIIRFINPEPLTKRGIQEHNQQIHLIYTDKRGAPLNYVVVAAKVGGSAFGTIFTKNSSNKRWIGKIGDTRDLVDRYNYTFEDLNIDVIFEKLASDLYKECGRGFFALPKTRLSEQPLINQFGPTKPRWAHDDYLFDFIQRNSDKSCLRIMSKYVDDYHNFTDALTLALDGTPTSCLDFIKKHHRPPETLLNPSKEAVPLYGLMELVAVGRVLADTDVLGGLCDNAGFVWVHENGTIIGANAIKIDPGKAFHFSNVRGSIPIEFNWVLNTKYSPHLSGKLDNLKDIQTAQNYRPVTLHWDALTPTQKEIFLGILFNSSRYLQVPDVLNYLFYRDGKFQHLPLLIAQQFQKEMKEWLELQLEIYADDLHPFHQKYPEQALRAYYIDTCGELTIPMSKETFPIRELFTELVIVQGTNPITGTPEKDSFKETTDHLGLLANTISHKSLFDNKRRVLLIGRAGIGKSTLCQKIAHDWASGLLWNDTFDCIYWIPLRQLNDADVSGDPYAFLEKVAIPCIFNKIPSVKTLSQQIGQPGKKILLILDGYDETSTKLASQVSRILQETSHHILITSRPGKAVKDLAVDQIVENIGFSDTHIQTYIDKFAKRHDDQAKPSAEVLFNTLKQSPYLYPVAHIPLQLQMIVSLFERTGHILQATSLTQLYRLITHELYRWQLPTHTQEEEQKNLLLLGQIAKIGFQTGKLIIPREEVQHLLTGTLFDTGLIKETHGDKTDIYFLHLTFQEYLTAFYIAAQSRATQKQCIHDHRHKSTYQLVFAFLAGFLRTDPAKLERFFAVLHEELPNTLSLPPSYRLELSLRCLNECEGLESKIPAIDGLITTHPNVLTQPLSDGLLPLQSLTAQGQNVALNWLITHYSDQIYKKEEKSLLIPPSSSLPTGITTPGQLSVHVLSLLRKPVVQQDAPLSAFLDQKYDELLNKTFDSQLTQNEIKLHHCTSNLFDEHGQICSIIRKKLLQLYPGTTIQQTQTITTTAVILAPTMPNCAFGKAKWALHFGDVGEEPPLPPDIYEILQGPCPIWKGFWSLWRKKVEETHVLVLIPASVDGMPLTLQSLGELVQNPKSGPATKCKYFNLGEYQDVAEARSYWILMSRDVLEGSRGEDWKTQTRQVATLAKTTGIPYNMPKVREAAICLFTHYVSTGEKLYSRDPWTYTQCEEFHTKQENYKIVIGGLGADGLGITRNGWYDSQFDGVGVVRKFL